MDGCKLISRGKNLVIPPTSGNELLSEPKKKIFFTGFPKGCSGAVFSSMPATPETPVAVFELRENRSIKAACCDNPQTHCFSSYLQVKAFCQAHPGWLRGDFPTLFPFRAGENILFADAYVTLDDRIVITTDDIGFPMLFAGWHLPRIVVPKMKKVRVH